MLRDTLRLSDAFKLNKAGPSMELVVKVIDVNHENGGEILGKSSSLNGYAYLVATIRGFMDEGLIRDTAIKATSINSEILRSVCTECERQVSFSPDFKGKLTNSERLRSAVSKIFGFWRLPKECHTEMHR